MVAYNASIFFDQAIYAQHFRGSVAYARANAKISILTWDECSIIERGFGQILQEWQTEKFVIQPGVTGRPYGQREGTRRNFRQGNRGEAGYPTEER